MQGTLCWLDLNIIPSDYGLGVLPCAYMFYAERVFCRLFCVLC